MTEQDADELMLRIEHLHKWSTQALESGAEDLANGYAAELRALTELCKHRDYAFYHGIQAKLDFDFMLSEAFLDFRERLKDMQTWGLV